jgi:nickel superoxide dismutase
MRKYFRLAAAFAFLSSSVIFHGTIFGHCQMPCGIYDDQMIYDKIDQFYLTMVKAVGILTEKHDPETVQDKNQFVRWVMLKEKSCDEVADILTTYFLQQKFKPGDDDTTDLLKSAHKLLFLLVEIKQHVDLKIVRDFGKEWDRFKQLFHPEQSCEAHEKEHEHMTEPKDTSKEPKKL